MSGEYYPDRVRGEEGKGVSACGRIGVFGGCLCTTRPISPIGPLGPIRSHR